MGIRRLVYEYIKWVTDNFSGLPNYRKVSITSVKEFLDNNYEDYSNDVQKIKDIIKYVQGNENEIYGKEYWFRMNESNKINIISYYKNLCEYLKIVPIEIRFEKLKKSACTVFNPNTFEPLYIVFDLSNMMDIEYAIIHETTHQYFLLKYQNPIFNCKSNKKFTTFQNKLVDIFYFSDFSKRLNESISDFDMERIKLINSEIDEKKIKEFYKKIKTFEILEIPNDFKLGVDELLREKTGFILSKIRDLFPNEKSIDLALYIETLILLYSNIQGTIQQSIMPVIIKENFDKLFKKESLIGISKEIIENLFFVNNQLNNDMIQNVVFKNRQFDSINYYRILDAIKDYKKNPFEFLYCLSLLNIHTIKNLNSLGIKKAREVKYICNSIEANPKKYNVEN